MSLSKGRLLTGLAIQPFLAGGIAFASFPVLLLDRSGRTLAGGVPSDATAAALSVAIASGTVAILMTFFVVLPTVVWLTNRRRVSLSHALLFGLAFGNVPFAIGTLLVGPHGLAGFMRGLAFSSLLGLVGAAAFWAVALRSHRGRPEPA